MRTDLRLKHDIELRTAAIRLFDVGCGSRFVASNLSIPKDTVRKWLQIYEQKVAAASAVVDKGTTKAAAMAKFGIMSLSPLERWCRLYREGGAEALRPKPKGRPKGPEVKPHERTREQELEERCSRLEAEVAYLKKLRALVERDGL